MNTSFAIDGRRQYHPQVSTRCALCVDRCPTGVIILGKVTDQWGDGDPNERTNRHGYAYGVRF